ncbi:spermidine/putrescine ABC transporter substrate-binding protein, partial [Salmonella enterica]|nr:spermidine/putrescine ABC transporter substrate-binding protein [Salmonella enterica]
MTELDNLALRAALARGVVTRRTAMAGGAGAIALALAACGSKGKNPTPKGSGSAAPSAKAAQDMSDSEKLVNWSNWPEYIDVDDKTQARPSLVAFTKKTGIKVN